MSDDDYQDYSGYYAANGITRKPPAVSSDDEFEELDPDEPQEKDDGQWFVTALLAIVVFTVSFGLFTFFEPPLYTYNPSKVYYSSMRIVMSSFSDGIIEEKREEYLDKNGIDFSTLVISADDETSDAMKAVAQKCLLKGKTFDKVMPADTPRFFQTASDYLDCAMNTRVERFCSADERQRLAAQLIRYLELREHVQGVRRVYVSMTKSKMAQFAMNMQQRISGDGVEHGKVTVEIDLDERVVRDIRKLSEKGYLYPDDFSWMGLVLPRAYLPYLVWGAAPPEACAG